MYLEINCFHTVTLFWLVLNGDWKIFPSFVFRAQQFYSIGSFLLLLHILDSMRDVSCTEAHIVPRMWQVPTNFICRNP